MNDKHVDHDDADVDDDPAVTRENSNGQLPKEGRLGGIDFGTVRIGLATCDQSQTWAAPYETYSRRTAELDADYLREFSSNQELVGWVIGLPVHCDGRESQKSQEVRKFAVWLRSVSSLPYAFFDERFTTAEANTLLRETGLSFRKKKTKVDRLAAHLILTHYLGATNVSSHIDALEDGPTPSCG